MAVDQLDPCTASCNAMTPQTLFWVMAGLFAVYVGVDVLLAMSVVRRKVQKHRSAHAS
jgi:hypothetical protein|tara:strand:+ start:300 stop:473 length:174 start_codon:yes stop_codon:yes gene_type:complete